MNRSAIALSLLASVTVAGADAQEARYLDDRSSAASLVASLYNAIDRKEYGRAWGYFGEAKPARDFETFVKGYETTKSVRVVTGSVASEGAAGSTYYSIPVAISSVGTDDMEQVFAGCYTARLANPQIQGEIFTPLHLEKGSLAKSDKPLDDAVPANCTGAPEPDKVDKALDKAKAAFEATHGECEKALPETDPANVSPEAFTIRYRTKYDAEGDPEREMRLFRFYCSRGAYNETHVYYLSDDLDGLRELHFATPELDIRYENNDSEGKLEGVAIIGYQSDDRLVNSSYDEATKTIVSAAKWRGVGDASSSGIWILRDGHFTLVKYEVDASYDGEINPETLLDFDTGP